MVGESESASAKKKTFFSASLKSKGSWWLGGIQYRRSAFLKSDLLILFGEKFTVQIKILKGKDPRELLLCSVDFKRDLFLINL